VRALGDVLGTPVSLFPVWPRKDSGQNRKKGEIIFAALPRVALVPRLPRAKKSPREKSQTQIKPFRLGLVQSPKIQTVPFGVGIKRSAK